MVCSFQVLEHNPFDRLDDLIIHMTNFTKKYVYISLPYNGGWFSFSLSIRLPKFNISSIKSFTVDYFGGRKINTEPFYSRPLERFHSPHWWEVGRPGTGKKAVISKFESHGLRLLDSFHNELYPHHLFLLFEKRN